MVWGGTIGNTDTIVLVLGEKNNQGTITAQINIDNILQTTLGPFWF